MALKSCTGIYFGTLVTVVNIKVNSVLLFMHMYTYSLRAASLFDFKFGLFILFWWCLLRSCWYKDWFTAHPHSGSFEKKQAFTSIQLRYDVSGKYLGFNFWWFFIEPTPFRSYIGYILFYYLYEVPTYYLEKCKNNPLPTLGQRQFFYKTNIKNVKAACCLDQHFTISGFVLNKKWK